MVQRKKVTTRRCGKCKTTFPVGAGHDARTCGNTNPQRNKLHQPTPAPPQHATKLGKRSTLEVTNPRNAPVLLKKPIPAGLLKTMTWELDDEEGNRVVKLVDEKGRYISPSFLGSYNCLETDDCTIWFNEEGQQHRVDGPAEERVSGYKEWVVNGKRHRVDGPAIEYSDGSKEWWVDGKQHRVDGPSEEWPDGSKAWRVNGKLHRVDGPAVEWADGDKAWWVDDLHMREHADHPDIPEMMGDYFYLLCTNPNPQIRVKALANPNCPPAYRIAGKLA